MGDSGSAWVEAVSAWGGWRRDARPCQPPRSVTPPHCSHANHLIHTLILSEPPSLISLDDPLIDPVLVNKQVRSAARDRDQSVDFINYRKKSK